MSLIVMMSLTSCVSQKKILYLQNETMLNDSTFTSIEYENERHFDYKVQPGDILYIKIMSLDERFAKYFNATNGMNTTATGGNSSGNSGLYLNGYVIDEDGFEYGDIEDLVTKGETLIK